MRWEWLQSQEQLVSHSYMRRVTAGNRFAILYPSSGTVEMRVVVDFVDVKPDRDAKIIEQVL